MKLDDAVSMIEKRTMAGYNLTPEEKDAMIRLTAFYKRVEQIIFDDNGKTENSDTDIVDAICAELRRC